MEQVFGELAARIDFQLDIHGSVSLLTARSTRAKAWATRHLPDDAQTFCEAVVIEHRYVEDIALRVLRSGMSIAYMPLPAAH